MNKNTLIVFAGNSGTTETAAGIILETVKNLGGHGESSHVNDVTTLAGVHRVIIGSPLYYGKCPLDITRFLNKHETALAQKNVLFFFTCMRLTRTKETMAWPVHIDPQLEEEPKPLSRMGVMEKSHSISHYLAPLENIFSRIRPQGLGFFKGDLVFSRLNLKSCLVMKFMALLMAQVCAGKFLDRESLFQWVRSQIHIPADPADEKKGS